MVQSRETALLIDAGISAKRIMMALEVTETPLEKVKGVLITHEHTDHIRGLKVLLKRLGQPPAFANQQTWQAMGITDFVSFRQVFETGELFQVGDIQVKAFPTFHDAAEPVGYSFFAGGRKLSIVTDTGKIEEEILKEIGDAHTIVMEANHEEELLLLGRYPYYLKRRILSDKGHLSNRAAALALCHLPEWKQEERTVLFAHLSKENNFPESVFQTVQEVFPQGQRFTMDILLRDQVSCIYMV
jgi:phosphoribosyl 1,2-cyclic phosphodiesterase